MSLENDIRRGELARSVLENEVYIEAYESIEKGLIKRWRDSKDKAEREQIHQLLLQLDKAKTVMEGVMKSGAVALDKLKTERSRLQRLGESFRRA